MKFFVLWVASRVVFGYQRVSLSRPMPSPISYMTVFDNKLFVGRSSGHFSIFNPKMKLINSHQFDAHIHSMCISHNTLVINTLSPSSEHFYNYKSNVYYHTSKQERFRFATIWTDALVYEWINNQESLWIRVNYKGHVIMTHMESRERFILFLNETIQVCTGNKDILYVITDDQRLLVYSLNLKDRSFQLTHTVQLRLPQVPIHHVLVEKRASCIVVIVSVFQQGLYLYYFVEEEPNQPWRPTHNFHYKNTNRIYDVVLASPYLFCVDEKCVQQIRIPVYNDPHFFPPKQISQYGLRYPYHMTNQVVVFNELVCLNGEDDLVIVTSMKNNE